MSLFAASGDFGESFILEIAALVILVILIARYVAPPLRRAMNTKIESIRAQLAAGEEARKVTAALIEQRQQELAAARAEAGEIAEQAQVSAAQIVADGTARAAAELERLRARTVVEIGLEHAQVRDEVLARIGALVAQGVALVVEAELNEPKHHRLIDEAIAATESEAAV